LIIVNLFYHTFDVSSYYRESHPPSHSQKWIIILSSQPVDIFIPYSYVFKIALV